MVKAEEVISIEDIILNKAFGKIIGVAVDSNNNRLSDVEISISLKNEEKFNIITDENGYFVVDEVIDGDGYTVSAKKDGYGDNKIIYLQVLPSKAIEDIMRLSSKISINNGDFDLGNLDGWTVIDENNSASAQDRSKGDNDAPSGKYALSLWNDKPYIAKVSQEVAGIIDGKYELSAYVYNGGNQNKANMYIKDGENIAEFELPKTTYWTKVSMEVWIENETIEIGFDFDAKSGCWVLIDSVQLNFITAIDYENLEKTIKEYETLIEENYTPNSWNIFKANKEVLSAKIEEVKSIDLSKYTEESSIVLKDALYKALNIEADENAMQEAVDEAILKLDEAIKSLVEKIIEPDVDDEIKDDDSIGDSSKDEEDDKDQNPVIEDTKKILL